MRQSVSYTFADNGRYDVTLTVSDTYGATVSQSQTLVVANAAPIVECRPSDR